jgi:chemotaxis protein MotB
MTRTLRILSLAVLALLLTGCVSADSYNALKMDRDRYMEQLATSQTDANAAKAKAEALQRQIDAIMGNSGTKEALILNLQSANGDLQARLDELTRKYEAALNRPAAGGPLPPELSNELTAFAQQNPDLVEFDASRGIMKFRSDVTFALGDADLTPKPKDVIRRFASILNSGAASQYELMVAGHTDNTPVVNPATIAKKAKGRADAEEKDHPLGLPAPWLAGAEWGGCVLGIHWPPRGEAGPIRR